MTPTATCPSTTAFAARFAPEGLRAVALDTVQVNVGLRCNLACRHCHVASSPTRTEEMSRDTMLRVLDVARRAGARTLDVTGGAPELHPHFREFVGTAAERGLAVLVRTNLTVLLREELRDLPAFFRAARTGLVASLPCYLEENVERQRGKDVYSESVAALRILNAAGYGVDPALKLHLVYNPAGAALPPAQDRLEADYRRELDRRFGVRFTGLYALANVPIGRFAEDLRRGGDLAHYLRTLREAFNPATAEGLMCRRQIHVGWDGALFDCDFNFAARLPVVPEVGAHIDRFDPVAHATRRIAVGEHCFACTAGSGSSCGGALV